MCPVHCCLVSTTAGRPYIYSLYLGATGGAATRSAEEARRAHARGLAGEGAGGAQPRLVAQAAFSPDGRFIVSGSSDSCVYIWEVSQPELPPVRLPGHRGEVTGVDWCPDDCASSSESLVICSRSLTNSSRCQSSPLGDLFAITHQLVSLSILTAQ